MGGSASKAARKLPSRPQPSWAGARTNLEARTSTKNPAAEAQDRKNECEALIQIVAPLSP